MRKFVQQIPNKSGTQKNQQNYKIPDFIYGQLNQMKKQYQEQTRKKVEKKESQKNEDHKNFDNDYQLKPETENTKINQKSGNTQDTYFRINRSISTNNEQSGGVKKQIENKSRQQKREFIEVPEKRKENQLIDAFKQHGFDIIDILNSYEYEKLFIFTNILFYQNKNQQNIENLQQSGVCQYKINGKLYHTLFDYNQNPKFIIQEGEFLVDVNNASFCLDGQGIEYYGKSNQIKTTGEFKKGVYQRIQQSQNRSEYKSQSVEPRRIKILEIFDGQPIQLNNKIEKKKIWCKYNQQFQQSDLIILTCQMWLNSSIIDCYVLHLNNISEEEYFKLSLDKRQHIKRIYFVTSSLITNFGKSYNISQAIELFQQHFLELQEIKYEIQTIYSKFGFPINSNKHWYFLLFDLKEKKVDIFNSISCLYYDKPLIQCLSDLLMLKSPQICKNSNSGQQKDSYSCGYHVCQFMKYCQEEQFSNSSNYFYNEKQMKEILRDLIKD